MLLTLPQETLNEVIVHLHGEERALQSLSLVHSRFTDECRRSLFASVQIDSAEKLLRWFDTIPPGKDGLSRYVRLLDMDVLPGESPSILIFLRDNPPHLRSFTQLEHLRIRPLDFFPYADRELISCFGHFQNVRSVSIQPNGSGSTVLDFLALFPLLETTVITAPSLSRGSEVAHPFNLVCRGDLILKTCSINHAESIFSCLARATTCYRRLALGLVTVFDFSSLERFFESCSDSLESLQLINCFIPTWVHCPDTLLSSSTQLQDITLSIRFLTDHPHLFTILSSITSTKISSVTFVVFECYYPEDLENFCLKWMKVETALCRLSELKKGAGSGGKVVLNVHFDDERLMNEVHGFVERWEFMPRFQEGGTVKVGRQQIGMSQAMSNIMPEEFSWQSGPGIARM